MVQQAAIDGLKSRATKLTTRSRRYPARRYAAKFGLKDDDDCGDRCQRSGRWSKPVALPLAKDEILKTVFSTEQGDTSRVSQTQDGAIFAVRVDKVVAPQVRPLAEVRDKAVAAGRRSRSERTVAKEAEALAASVRPSCPCQGGATRN
jgi:hypothetical protein